MKLFLELSMECESLARAEALSASASMGSPAVKVFEEPGILVIETSASPDALVSRLALCHHVSEWLGHCPAKNVEDYVSRFSVEGPLRVRSTKIGASGIDLSATTRKVGAILGGRAGVDLHNPRNEVRVVYSRQVHFGRLLGSVDRPSFEKRKNRYMPYFYPASVHPKFARALVNLTQVRNGGRILDPFCGTGAIVAEASLIGLHAIGTDFSDAMIEGSKRNLKHIGVTADFHTCDVGDISNVVGSVDGVATDPPYGKSTSTKGESIHSLYLRSFKAFGEILDRGARVAIVVPDTRLLAGVDWFETVERHDLRVHRSLTRHFCVLSKV